MATSLISRLGFLKSLALWSASISLLLAPRLFAGAIIISVADQLDRGWYDSAGNAAPTNTSFGFGGNYTVGMTGVEARNFFVFKIPQISEPIIRAELVLFCTPPEDGGYVSPDPTETFVLFSLDYFSVDVLRRRDTNEASFAVFEDLGDGTPYSNPAIFTPTNQNSEVAIELNTDFLAAVTNHIGQSIALGGRLTSIQSYPTVIEALFGYSHHVPFERTYLVLYTPAVARLEINRNPDATLTLSFPIEFTNYILESTDSITNPNWTEVLLPREQIDDMMIITLDPSAPSQLFRLRSPQ